MEKLEISLFISTYQRPHLLRLCLASIQSQQGVEGAFEVIVSDDGSTDETPRVVDEFARSVKFPVSYATHPHTTFHPARCRNKGARAARARVEPGQTGGAGPEGIFMVRFGHRFSPRGRPARVVRSLCRRAAAAGLRATAAPRCRPAQPIAGH